MQHPDEGMIHAWLDGALAGEEARVLETHVDACERCAALVVEARGYLAGASRILSALDDAPRGIVPTSASPGTHAGASAPAARPMRFRAARYRIAAALVILAGGAYVVAREAPPDDALLDRALESALEAPAMSTATMGATESADDGARDARTGATAERQAAAPSERDAPPSAAPAPEAAPSAALAVPSRERREQEQGHLARRMAEREPLSSDSVAIGAMRPDFSGGLARHAGSRDTAAPGFKVIAERSAPAAAPAAQPSAQAAAEDLMRQERASNAVVQSSEAVATGAATRGDAASSVAWAAPACYEIDLGAFDARSDDERRALTPPRRIRLDTASASEALESGTFAVRPAAGEATGAHRFAEWKPTGESALLIRFSDGFQGIELALVRDGEGLRGRARGTGDASGAGETPVRLTRIACDEGR